MSVVIRPTAPDELRQASVVVRNALLDSPPDDEAWAKAERSWLDQRSFSAWDGTQCVGHVSAFDVETVLPGGRRLATAAITRAGVLATHSGQGVFTRLMDALLTDVAGRAIPLASLRASESTIYERFGFGVSGDALAVTIDVARCRPVRGGAAGTFEMLGPEQVLGTVMPVYERAATRAGVISRPRWMWERYFENVIGGHSAESVVVHRSPDGAVDGYSHYELSWTDGVFATDHGRGKVHEVWATDPAVEIALWAWLFDIALVRTITVDELAVDSVLFASVYDSRAVKVEMRWDEQWLRILDLDVALTHRDWADATSVVVAVADPRSHVAGGRWRIGHGGATTTTDPADLTTDVAGLSAAYLGSTSWWTLVAVGRASADNPEAIARGDAVFAHRPLAFSGSFF